MNAALEHNAIHASYSVDAITLNDKRQGWPDIQRVFFTGVLSVQKVADSSGAVIQKQRHRSHSDENSISRTSSGSVSIDITWPTSHRVKSAVVAGCCAKDVR